MADYVELSIGQVALAAALIVINGALSLWMRLRLERSLAWASVRMVAQLSLMGVVLQWVFSTRAWPLVLLLMLAMTLVAGQTGVRRVDRTYPGIYWHSIVSVWARLLADHGVCRLGNPPPGRSVAAAAVRHPAAGDDPGQHAQRHFAGPRPAGRATWWPTRPGRAAPGPGRHPLGGRPAAVQQAVRTGMIPTINSMLVAGIVSLPGMMTGQLLAGSIRSMR